MFQNKKLDWKWSTYTISGPLREKISSLKKFDAVFLNGDSDNFE